MKTYVIVIIIIIIVVVVVVIHSCDEVDTGVEHYEHEAHVADGVEGAVCPSRTDLLPFLMRRHDHQCCLLTEAKPSHLTGKLTVHRYQSYSSCILRPSV